MISNHYRLSIIVSDFEFVNNGLEYSRAKDGDRFTNTNQPSVKSVCHIMTQWCCGQQIITQMSSIDAICCCFFFIKNRSYNYIDRVNYIRVKNESLNPKTNPTRFLRWLYFPGFTFSSLPKFIGNRLLVKYYYTNLLAHGQLL